MTIQDPSEETKTGYNGSNFVSVWCRDNRQGQYWRKYRFDFYS